MTLKISALFCVNKFSVVMFIDTHAHLDFPDFKAEIGSMIGHANAAGVKKIINVGVDLESSKKSSQFSRHYPEMYAAIGIHPHSAKDLDLETRPTLTGYSANRKVVAFG